MATQSIGEIIEVNKIVCREFDLNEIWRFICHVNHRIIIWSWGIRLPVIMKKNQCLRFRVNGKKHAGHVYIVLNGSDLFDVYYTTIHGKIQKVSTDVYLDSLIDTLDIDIES